MSMDQKFYGVYRGKVYDSNDPDNLGRVQLIIPQILGQSVTDWAYPIGGAITQSKYPYGTFYTTGSQTLGVSTPTVISGWVDADSNLSYVDGTKLYVKETGDYFFQFSAMLSKSNASTGTAEVWVRKNGTNVAASNTRVTLSGSGAETVMTVSLVLDLEANDYLELVGSANSTNTSVISSSGTGPAIPGVIATLNLIGKWKPQPGTGVWVMFEGGDPNFPLWIGGQ